jgi:hypothetical protein
MKFTEFSSGLYYFDTQALPHSGQHNTGFLFLNTVANKKFAYTKAKIDGAGCA